jgi:hypothetical protein
LRKIRFKDEYIPLILEGKKTSTIRLEKKFRVGETLAVTSVKTGKIYCRIRVTSIVQKRLGELTDDDASRDGFRGRADLIKALKRIYGDIRSDRKLYVIRFKRI